MIPSVPIPTEGFILTRHAHDRRGQPQIILWIATNQGPVRLVIENEQPLFFVYQVDQQRVIELLRRHGVHGTLRRLDLCDFEQRGMTACYLENLSYYFKAQDLLRAEGIPCLEGDIRFVERYLMERYIRGGIRFSAKLNHLDGYFKGTDVRCAPCEFNPHLSWVSLDIECSMQGELYSIGLYSQQDQRVLMIGINESAQLGIEWVADERALLLALQDWFNAFDPDLVLGWNVINFDCKLLCERAQRLGVELRLGRGGGQLIWRSSVRDPESGHIQLPGRVVLDGIATLKSATWQFDSFSLDSVAHELLGRGKVIEDVVNRGAKITELFHQNKLALARYNLEDCRLVWEIFEHCQLLEFVIERARLTGLELDRVGGSVAAFTNLYLPRLHRAGYVAPNLPLAGGLTSPGGYVMDSEPGLYSHVLVLDFKSLYPSIIRTFCIDPLGLIEGLKSPTDAIEGFRGALFSRQHHFLPAMIETLWQARDAAKAQHNAALSQAIKIIMNSFYGVLGSAGCRFYDPRLASSITLRGHELMQMTCSWIETEGYKVIYGDTDSLFVWLNGDYSDDDCDRIGRQLSEMVNLRWQEQLSNRYGINSCLELEYETHYRRFLMPTIRGLEKGSKKRYAGLVYRNGEERLVFKGLETVRTDWTQLAKEFQTELYQLVFAKLPVSDFIRQQVQRTRNGELDNQLVYRKRLRQKLSAYQKNVPPHVRAARLADEINLQRGEPLHYQNMGWIHYFMTTNGPEAAEYLQSPLDYEHYIERQLRPIADAILPFIGESFDHLLGGQMDLFG